MNKLLSLTCLLLALLIQCSHGRIVYAVLENSNTLIKFSSTNPTQLFYSLAITGMGAGEVVIGIDFRPYNGKLYVVSTGNAVYYVNTITGAATLSCNIDTSQCAISGVNDYATDFNPVVDRLRLISSSGQNYRINVDTGDCNVDATINNPTGTTPTLIQAAYTNNFRGAPSTTLYVFDLNANQLGQLTSPNDGTYAAIGSLGVTITAAGGFDSVPATASSTALLWAALTVNGVTGLYSINPASGAATAIGTIGNGGSLSAITISLTPYETSFVSLNDNGDLIRFDSEDASSTITTAITGLTNEFLLGLDFRPLNGQLYAISNASRVFIINPITAVATAVGSTLNCSFSGTYFGVDWNPVVDLLRIISDSGANYRVNVTSSACFIDGVINSNATIAPRISSIAYTNNFFNAPSTQLFAIDFAGETLGVVDPPNSGNYGVVSNLSIKTGPRTGFDIFGSNSQNFAVAIIELDGLPYFVSVDLTTSALAFIAQAGNIFARSLSASFSRIPYSISGYNPDIFLMTGDSPQQFVGFNSATPTIAVTAVSITGLVSGTNLLGVALRPATNEIVGVSSDSKLYIVYPPTGQTYFVADLNCTLQSGVTYAFDFNPVADRLRIVSSNGDNYRVNADNGNCFVDGSLNYTSGATGTPSAVGVAYTNSFAGANTTAEYIFDQNNDGYAQVTVPNAGTTSFISAVGLDVTGATPYDILTNGVQQQGFVVINGILYGVNVQTGTLTTYGSVSTTSPILGLVALPQGYTSPAAPTVTPTTGSTEVATTAAAAATTAAATTGDDNAATTAAAAATTAAASATTAAAAAATSAAAAGTTAAASATTGEITETSGAAYVSASFLIGACMLAILQF